MKNISLNSAVVSTQSGTPDGKLAAIQLSVLKWLTGAIEKDTTWRRESDHM